tara:strand:- start:2395 stop:3021 length:627 start_codon:yes stop_codon:yes gene_type:complete
MQLKDYFYFFPGAVPERICDDIVKHALSFKGQRAITGSSVAGKMSIAQIKNLKKQRDSNIVWLNERWIYKEIQPYIHQANANADWNFQWDCSEACQFTKYYKDQFYDWHCDGFPEAYNLPEDPMRHGKIRKLSVTVSLSDGKEYSGGDFEVDFRNMEPNKESSIRAVTEIRPKGSVIVFPADLWHRITPIKKGKRYSLVIWNLGNPFK